MYPFKATIFVLLISLFAVGCSPSPATVDDGPFRKSIGEYLQANNMAMKINEIKEGPIVEGDVARLTASMTHEQLGGPSVTWDFRFTKQPDGSWRASRPEN